MIASLIRVDTQKTMARSGMIAAVSTKLPDSPETLFINHQMTALRAKIGSGKNTCCAKHSVRLFPGTGQIPCAQRFVLKINREPVEGRIVLPDTIAHLCKMMVPSGPVSQSHQRQQDSGPLQWLREGWPGCAT